MGIFDTLFGRQKPVPPAKDERLFAISTAQLTLQTSERLAASKEAGICFKGMASGPFAQVMDDLRGVLKAEAKDAPVSARDLEDSLGYRWVILESDDFQTLVTTIHMISQTLIDEGYGEQLLAAVFRFDEMMGKPYYFIYNYKRGTFYPFVPRPDSHSHERDNAEEVRISGAMKGELPIEPELERWFALWDLPF
jgi:hypothetical protein